MQVILLHNLINLAFKGSLEGAYYYAGEGGLIGRTHFARFLAEQGYAKNVKSVFKKFLVKRKTWIRIT